MTPREKAVALLAEALHPDDVACVAHESFKYGGDCERDHAGHAKAMLGASPALASALELGVAWQMAEAALPEGWDIKQVTHWPDDPPEWQAQARHPRMAGMKDFRHGEGSTPAEALAALAAALEADRA